MNIIKLEATVDRKYIEQHNMIERYLLGQLNEEQAAAFEDRFTFDSALRDEIDATEKLMHGIRQTSAAEPNADTATETHHTDNITVLPNPPARALTGTSTFNRYRLPLALAANLVLGISTVYFYQQSRSVTPPALDSGQLNPPALYLETSRSAAQNAPNISVGRGWLTLVIDNPLQQPTQQIHREYRLQVRNHYNGVVLESAAFAPSPDHPWIEWLIPRNQLMPGTYQLALINTQASEPTPSTQFRFVITATDRGAKSNSQPSERQQ